MHITLFIPYLLDHRNLLWSSFTSVLLQKINWSPKLVYFLYTAITNWKIYLGEKRVPFTTIKPINYRVINFTRKMQNLYEENDLSILKDIRPKWRHIPNTWIERYYLKILILSSLKLKFISIQKGFFNNLKIQSSYTFFKNSGGDVFI